MRPSLRDPGLQDDLERDGYVVVPFLDPAAVAGLRRSFSALVPDLGGASHYTSASPDEAHRRAAFASIAAAFSGPAADLLVDHRPVVANFFAKPPAPATALVVHQDWTFVDEDRFRSINIWCPLEDATAANGTLRVLPGSHRALTNRRGTALGAGGLPSPFAGIEDEVTRDLLVPVPVPAGSAIVNDHRLVHASTDNTSADVRVAASLTLVPAECPVTHSFGHADGTVELFELEDDELLRHAIGTPPRGRSLGVVPFVPQTVTVADLVDLCGTGGQPGATRRRTPWGRAFHARRTVRRAGRGSLHQSPQTPR